jgi:hypothetical protein
VVAEADRLPSRQHQVPVRQHGDGVDVRRRSVDQGAELTSVDQATTEPGDQRARDDRRGAEQAASVDL